MSLFVKSSPAPAGTFVNAARPGDLPPPPRRFFHANHREHDLSAELKSLVVRHGTLKDLLYGARSEHARSPAIGEAKTLGARLHVSVRGLGVQFDTRSKAWGKDADAVHAHKAQLEQLKDAAATVGIELTGVDGGAGLRAWNDGGWKRFTHGELKTLKDLGFESADVRNLQQAGFCVSEQKLLAFYKEYAGWFRAGEVPRLMPSNLDFGQWRAVKDAIDAKSLDRAMFADFAVQTPGEVMDSFAHTSAAAKKLGITVLQASRYGDVDSRYEK